MRQEPTGIKTLTELSITTLARSIKRCTAVSLADFVMLFFTHNSRCQSVSWLAKRLLLFKVILYTSRVSTLDNLPEELALELLERVLSLGLLTPKVLEMFERLGHTDLDIRIAELNIQELPLLLPTTRNRWLGY